MDDGVSYLISLYNKQDHIEKTLAAVHAEWQVTGGEIIVYDDVSTDRSVQLVRGLPFASDITLVLGERNGGCVFATDRLIEAAAGYPYVRFVDGDDLVVAGSTSAMLAVAGDKGCALLFGRLVTIGDDIGQGSAEPPRRIEGALRFILKNTAYNPSGMLAVTAALKRIRPLPVHLRHSQDFIIGLRLALRGESIWSYGPVVALTPPEENNRLSRRMAEMFGSMTETVALEAGTTAFPLADLRYATARYASRCLRYFRRSRRAGRAILGPADVARLYLIMLGARFASARSCRDKLNHVAEVFYRDRAHVLTGA